MKCINCGHLLLKGDKFCENCGTKQIEEKKCKCGKNIEDDYKFCPECGSSFAKKKAADKKENERKINDARLEGSIEQAFSFIEQLWNGFR